MKIGRRFGLRDILCALKLIGSYVWRTFRITAALNVPRVYDELKMFTYRFFIVNVDAIFLANICTMLLVLLYQFYNS